MQIEKSAYLHKESMKPVSIRFFTPFCCITKNANNNTQWKTGPKSYDFKLKPSYPEIFAMLLIDRNLRWTININSAVEPFLIDRSYLPFVPLRYYRDITFKLGPLIGTLTFSKVSLLYITAISTSLQKKKPLLLLPCVLDTYWQKEMYI